MMMTKLSIINDIELTLLKCHSPQLNITVFGAASTGGWKDIHLVPYAYIAPPKDGIYEFDLVGTAPSGPATTVITPVVANYTWTAFPPDLKGIRVYAATNNQEKLLGKDTKYVSYD